MKPVTLMFAFLLLAAGAANSQMFDNPELHEKIALSESEIDRLNEISSKAQRVTREAQLELNLLKAQLEKLLFSPDVDMNEVEKILRTSLEWRLKGELAEIRERVELRKFLGEDRWRQAIRWKRLKILEKRKAIREQESSR